MNLFFSKVRSSRRGRRAGFTLLELVTVIGIVSVITGVVVVNSSKFDSSIVLTNFAYDLALSLREAQAAGLHTRQFGTGSSATFNTGYGINFYTTNEDGSLNTTDYILFADLISSGAVVGDFLYNGNSIGGPEFVKRYSALRGNIIDRFCGVKIDNSEECSTAGGISYLSVVFIRPNPDAVFHSSSGETYRAVKIYVKSVNNTSKAIRVELTGQIAVCSALWC